MVAFAVESSLAALERSGLTEEEGRALGILAVSHNGPCVYSEEFFAQLLAEPNPQLVSPILFAESVLNIAGTHISLATGSHRPVHALNAPLPDFLDVFDTLFLLAGDASFERGILCACDEFSEPCARLFARCEDFPGRRFVDAATALVFSTDSPAAAGGTTLEAPGRVPVDAFGDVARGLAAAALVELVASAYADASTTQAALPGGRPGPIRPGSPRHGGGAELRLFAAGRGAPAGRPQSARGVGRPRR